MNQAALLNQFRAASVATASPAKLLTMLYDRLVLDLDRGQAAIEGGQRAEANTHLGHAQDIVHELRASLDVAAWDGGPGLMSIYNFLFAELVTANLTQNAAKVAACRDLVVPLRDAWHEAAAAVPATAAAAATGAVAVG